LNCPFCDEEIKDQALVCKHCGRDLSVLRPVLGRMQDLETRLAAAETAIHALSAHVEAVRGADSPAHRKKSETETLTAIGVVDALVLPAGLLIAAHGLIVGLLDLNTWVLRVASILIPLAFGLRSRKSMQTALWMAAGIAVMAVFGMLVTTSLIDHVPVLPQGPRDWLETIEYIASIGLSHLTGRLFRWWFAMRKASTKGEASLVYQIAALLARTSGPRDESRARTRQRVEAIANWLNIVALLLTAACSIATGLGKFLG
jgi:hypothetical protein